MDVSEMLTTLEAHGYDTSIEDAEKLSAINDAIWDIESREPWPFLTKSANLNFDGINPAPSNLPADFKAVIWLQDLRNGVPIWPVRVETIRQNFTSTTVAVTDPQNFYFVGEQLRLWPVPPSDSSGRYLLDYLAAQTELTSTSISTDILLPPRYHRMIVDGAIVRLALMEDDEDISAFFSQRFEARIQQMKYDLFKKQHMRADQVFEITQDDTYENFPY